MLLPLFLLAIIFQIGYTRKVPICKSFEYSANITASERGYSISPTYYSYNFDMNLEVTNEFQNFPNKLTIYNFKESTLNNSDLFLPSSLTFSSQNFEFKHKLNCTLPNQTCTFYVGDGDLMFGIVYNYSQERSKKKLNFDLLQYLGGYINKGEIFDSNGQYFNPENRQCITQSSGRMNSYVHKSQFCCKNFESIEIPNDSEDQCVEFETNGKFKYFFQDVVVSYNINYMLTFDASLVSTVKITNAPNVTYQYRSRVNRWQYCQGTNKELPSICEYSLPLKEDFDWEFEFAFSTQQSYIMTTVGEFKRRNGTFLKSNNDLFTPENPCSTHNSTIPSMYLTSENTFCCKKFKSVNTWPWPKFIETSPKTSTADAATTLISTSPTTERETVPTPILSKSSNFLQMKMMALLNAVLIIILIILIIYINFFKTSEAKYSKIIFV